MTQHITQGTGLNLSPKPISLTQLPLPQCNEAGVELWVLRLDQTDARISGNKWFKLKYNLEQALSGGYRSLLSFGGAYSNHIHALAWAAKELDIPCVGVIRGESEYATNPTLSDATEWGMQLRFVNRQQYRRRAEPDFIKELIDQLPGSLKPVYQVPEGGSNALAVKGCMEILSDQTIGPFNPTHVVLPCGTGGTLSGVALSRPDIEVIGIPVLKKAEFLYEDIRKLISGAGETDPQNWQLDLEGHFGGYAKTSPELLQFIEQMDEQYELPLDQVYTGKMMKRLIELVEQGRFTKGSKILAIHTGGLQGMRTVYGPKN
ncbi:1-aminocyclopropane-1-carboxylate deaminase/D-cysteine desulfhydrase [Neptuniibacter sp.]|uniref:1-aminocyclopropane-1-carboxylate deaminase/D-cysteine desulfhydrase n=1 Tax=Neptuniibacter sp. TaxID=1962643 RepID=UPI00260ED48A|nr:pyridoxal-phosphate dependent enzyme [Neptuniibacter sp.]MCP4596354.1 1-aminocyclopropane-1-carboxylate deaminase/D-cysteine desulfhydrase [Neptuniibacter sp.]